MDAAAEIKNTVSTRFSLGMEMSRLMRDGTGLPNEALSRNQNSGANGDREISIFSVQLTTSRTSDLTRLIRTLRYVMTIHT